VGFGDLSRLEYRNLTPQEIEQKNREIVTKSKKIVVLCSQTGGVNRVLGLPDPKKHPYQQEVINWRIFSQSDPGAELTFNNPSQLENFANLFPGKPVEFYRQAGWDPELHWDTYDDEPFATIIGHNLA
jgi:hypothetical protein